MATFILQLLAVAVLSYLIGSLPFGYVAGRLRGVDIRKYGSRRTGATNIQRTLGWKYAIPVAIGDTLKGVAVVLVARYLLPGQVWVEMGAILMALLGHNYSIFLRFTGGRGVLTSYGGVLAISPLTSLIITPIGLIPVILTRYVSLGSITGSVLAVVVDGALYLAGLEKHWEHVVSITVLAVIVIVSHKDNIARLRTGAERKLGQKSEGVAPK